MDVGFAMTDPIPLYIAALAAAGTFVVGLLCGWLIGSTAACSRCVKKGIT